MVASFDWQEVSSARAIIFIAWLNIILITIEVTLGLSYIVYSHINRRTKCVIICALSIDLACMIILCEEVVEIITLAKKKEWAYTWHTGVIVILSTISAALEQWTFFQRYCWQNWGATVLVSVLLSSRVIISVVSHILTLANTQQTFVFINTSALVSSALLVFADLLVAYITTWKNKSGLVLYGTWQRRTHQSVIHAITHGYISAVSSSLRLILYFLDFLGYRSLTHVIGRVYTLTLVITYIVTKEGQRQPNNRPAPSPSPNSGRRSALSNSIQLTSLFSDVVNEGVISEGVTCTRLNSPTTKDSRRSVYSGNIEVPIKN